MNLLDKRLREFILCPIYNKVDATEVVGGLDDIVDIDTFICNADSICLEDIPGLLMCQATPLDMIGIIGKVYLGAMIDTAANLTFLLFTETFQQRSYLQFAFSWQRGIGRNVPGLSYKNHPINLPGSAPVPDSALRETMLLSELADIGKKWRNLL